MNVKKLTVFPFLIGVLIFGACSPASTAAIQPAQITLAVKVEEKTSQAPEQPSTVSSNNNSAETMPPQGAPPSDAPSGGPGGTPPEGNPPDGGPQGGGNPPGGGPGGGADAASVTLTGAYTVDGQTVSETGKSYLASENDQSAIYVLNGGQLTLTNATISTSGASSSSDASSFYGLNAGVLAGAKSSINITDSSITTSGDGANGAFASGEGTVVGLVNSKIDCTGQYAHAVMATLGGVLNITNVDMSTTGASSGAIATDRGSGTINVSGGLIKTSGSNSPAIYSTGDINVVNATLSASGAEAAVIEGANSINLNNSSLISTQEDKWGVMIYQSFSGDAEGNRGDFSMTGGSLTYTSSRGPLFYVTNSTGDILLKDVEIKSVSGDLLRAAAGNWGNEGANGGTAVLTADKQSLEGDLAADAISTIDLTLQNGSSLTGAMNAAHTARAVNISLDASSAWILTADSYVTTIKNAAGFSGSSIGNISGNGHNIYYEPTSNPDLSAKTYNLKSGGYLKPLE
ncbi:MAG: hypothetical protein LWX83_09400 [Anaerolineae bacterium]|nr:hypothetical protein [Anaerolineae bacterium]